MRSTPFLSKGAASVLLIICAEAVNCLASQAPRSPLSLAVDQVQAGHYPEAAATLTAAIRANPKGGENLYLLLSECYVQLADPAKATATLRAGLRAYPAAPVLERALGQLLFRSKYDSSEAGALLDARKRGRGGKGAAVDRGPPQSGDAPQTEPGHTATIEYSCTRRVLCTLLSAVGTKDTCRALRHSTCCERETTG